MTQARTPRLDTEIVRQAAAARWPEILQSLAGLPAELLDGGHHPCPKCGGADRFRLIDQAAGAVLCNQCFSVKNGDGFAAVGWMLGLKFPAAVGRVAEYLGVAAAKGDADPAKDLEFTEWSSSLAAYFLAAKAGISEQALFDSGARMARYKGRFTVIAWPIIGQDLDATKPVGWVLANYNGSPLPKYNKEGEVVGQTKYKITYGSRPGLVGRHGVERLRVAGLAELVWKVEGVSDLLALMSIVPETIRDRHLVITNANGSKETPRWQSTVLATVNCNVLHDADRPGQDGAANWANQTAAQAAAGVTVRDVELPYEVAEDHGKDLRDWIGDNHSYADLLALADQSSTVEIARTETGEIDYSKAVNPALARVLKKLQLEILYEDESGAIRVFSTLLRKSSWIKRLSQFKYDDLLLVAGTPAMIHVVNSERDADEAADTWTMTDVRRAIGLDACAKRGQHDERGVGVWQGLDIDGNETETIVLVGNTEGARWNGDQVLRKIVEPRADGMVLDFGASSKDWYKFSELEKLFAEAADLSWRQKAISEAVALFSRWRWDCEIAPTLVTGLVLATWVQTIWDWRPLIGITGESNAGKSFLFNALGGGQNRRGIFGRLAYKPDQPSEAGVRQHMANMAIAILLDELEQSEDRHKILKMLRTSTRGGFISKGSTVPGKRGVDYVVRHIVWTAATEAGLHQQPDLNRWIQLDLLRANKEEAGNLSLPDPRELQHLGQKLLAIAVRSAIPAKKLTVAIKSARFPGIEPRTIEVYSAPAAILAAAEGHTDPGIARGMLKELLANVDYHEQSRTDQEELLGDILAASILLDSKSGVKSISHVLNSPAWRMEYSQRLEASGIRMLDNYDLFIAPKLASQHLLKGTRWQGLRIDQILRRLPGAVPRLLRIGGPPTRGVVVPGSLLDIQETAPPENF